MIIKVKIKPNSGKQEVVNVEGVDNEYIVYVKSPAEDNKANLELLKLLRKYLKNKKEKYDVENIKIIKGKTSRNKMVEVK